MGSSEFALRGRKLTVRIAANGLDALPHARSSSWVPGMSLDLEAAIAGPPPGARQVFVLHDVFGFEFAEIASVVGRSESACRQLAVRARRHMEDGRPRFDADREESEALAQRFFDAFEAGNIEGVRELLAADVQVIGDGGGKAPVWGKGIVGAGPVSRILVDMQTSSRQIGATFEPHEVNGQPGAIFRDRDGKVITTWTIDVIDGRIQTIRAVLNPDKLGHIGPVADAWAVLREASTIRTKRQARATSDC